jgi:hypothetical protein
MCDHNRSICPTCGQPVVPDGLTLPPVKARILDIVRRRPGVDAEALRAAVWPGADGGPETRSNLHVHVCQLNRALAPHGIAIRGSRFFGYRLQPLTEVSS